MWKFEANRCGFCDMLKIDLSELCHPDSVIAFVLRTQHRFFFKQMYSGFQQKILMSSLYVDLKQIDAAAMVLYG